MADHDLELRLNAPEVSLAQLISAGSVFAALLREVAKEFAGTERDPVKWIVEVRPGSVHLPVRGKSMSDRLPADALPELADVVVEGLTTLDEGPVRPPYFNDRALEQAKALANLATAELPLVVANGEAKVDATKRLMTHVDEVIGIPRESIGTIEGKLETLDIHSRPQRFAIFDLLTDRRVECYFGTRVELDEVLRGVGRRVAVTGVIKTRPSGERLAIEARELRIFPAEDELPTPDDVRGILRLPESA